MPPVSIIVPIYNSEDTIGDCIRSIVDQSFADIEIILVNDGSIDGSQQICDEYAQKDARIRVFFQENKGRSVARMNGLINSTGEWITFVDSDDTLPRNAIELLYGKANDNTDIVFGNGYSLPNEKRTVIPIDDFRHLAIRAEGTIGVPWGSMYRRTLLSEYAFDVPQDIYNGEDYIFWLRIVFNTEKPVSIVYNSVYNKGEEHTSNCFRWTADYCYKLNEYRMNSIPSQYHEEYIQDIFCDRMANMYSVATDTPKKKWQNSEYFRNLMNDAKENDIALSLKQRIFFLLPSRWMRRISTNMGNILREKYYIFLFIVGLAMLALNLFDTPTLSDDLVYRFVFQENLNDVPQKLENICDLAKSQYAHYFYINGRAVIQTIAQIFLCFTPPIVYKIVNSILFILLIHFCLLFIRIEKNSRLSASIYICFLLFVVLADFRTTMLWSLGTFYYLWVIVMNLGYILYIRKLERKIKLFDFFLAPIALLVGWTHESLSLPISITFIVYAVMNRNTIIKKPIILYFFWYIIGMLLCVFSPGILNRADGNISIYSRLISGAVNFVFNVRISWLLLIAMVVLYFRNKEAFYEEIKKYWTNYLVIILCLGIVFLCGTNIERVPFYADFVSMLVLVRLISNTTSIKFRNKSILFCNLILLLFLVFAFIVRRENYENYHYAEDQMREAGKEIISVRQPQKGENKILDILRNKYVNPSIEFGYYCVYMAFNSKDINMRQAAVLYGKKKMAFIPEDVIERIKKDKNAYKNYELDKNKNMYVWRMNDNRKVKRIIFKLKPEDTSKLLPHQRLLRYKDDTYIMDDDFHNSVVTIDNTPYLIFTCPTTNISRRIDTIHYENE